MQVKRLTIKVIPLISFVIGLLIATYPGFGQAQNGCDLDFKLLNEAYGKGEWGNAKEAAIKYLNSFLGKEVVQLSTIQFKYSENCKTNIPQVYYYLVQSCLRLYDLENAKKYYFEALANEYKINLDPSDEVLFRQLGTLKKHALNLYLGIISSDLKEIKIGLSYKLNERLYLETSFLNMHFNHGSNGSSGVFGKPLISDPKIFPNYFFRLTGYDRLADLAAYYKIPIVLSQKDANILYISLGYSVTYYLNSFIDTWNLIRYDSTAAGKEVYLPASKGKRYTQIDSLGVHMDLRRLYADRLNYAAFMNIGSSVRMKNLWEIFFEIKFSVGKNNRYIYKDFSSFKPGVDYFFLVFGITKKFNKIIERKNY